MAVNDLAELDAIELLAAYKAGTVTPLKVLQAVTERIARRNPEINAFATMNPAALTMARESAWRWQAGQARALEGVPVTVSDLVDVAGLPTRRGSKTTDPAAVNRDAPLIAVLRAAGAVIIGKTNVSEFGWKYLGDSPLYGVIRNPWNTLHTAGGPSGGAAAAAAGFFGPLHVADGAVCVSAAWNGVVGLKLGTRTENQGIIARSVADIALLAATLRGGEAQSEGLEIGVRGLKIGVLRYPGLAASASPMVWETVNAARDSLVRQGAELSGEIVIDQTDLDIGECFASMWELECARAVDDVALTRQGALDPGLLAVAAGAARLGEWNGQALPDRAAQAISALDVDIILCPTVAQGAPLVETKAPDPLRALKEEWAPWTMLFSLTGQAALTLPMGVDAEGLPVAVQIVALKKGDETLLRVARALERGLG